MTTLPFLLLSLSPFVIFDINYTLISCLICKSNTLWNILMVLGRNIEQSKTTCCVQEWQLCLSYSWCYLLLVYLTVIMHWFHVRYVSQTPFGIFWLYLVVMKNRIKRYVTYKNDNFGFFFFFFFFTFWSYRPFLCLNLISCLCSITRIPFRIFWWYLVQM